MSKIDLLFYLENRRYLIDFLQIATAKPFSGARKSIATENSYGFRQTKKKKEIHAALVLGLIVLMFAICWLPIYINHLITR